MQLCHEGRYRRQPRRRPPRPSWRSFFHRAPLNLYSARRPCQVCTNRCEAPTRKARATQQRGPEGGHCPPQGKGRGITYWQLASPLSRPQQPWARSRRKPGGVATACDPRQSPRRHRLRPCLGRSRCRGGLCAAAGSGPGRPSVFRRRGGNGVGSKHPRPCRPWSASTRARASCTKRPGVSLQGREVVAVARLAWHTGTLFRLRRAACGVRRAASGVRRS